MTDLKIAFWNVENCFKPGRATGRKTAPHDSTEYQAKIAALAQVISGMFSGTGPDLLGLAEIASRPVLNDLLSKIKEDFDVDFPNSIWISSHHSDQTGLALCARDDYFLEKPDLDNDTFPSQSEIKNASYSMRPYSLIATCRLPAAMGHFLVSINHWKSDDKNIPLCRKKRLIAAKWLQNRLVSKATECIVALGDFNAEVFDKCLDGRRHGLNTKRQYNFVLNGINDGRAFYNPTWRFNSPSLPCERFFTGTKKDSKPQTSRPGCWKIIDHLLVSGAAMTGLPLSLLEASFELHSTPEFSVHSQRIGRLEPKRWPENAQSTSEWDGCASDHFPVSAIFQY